MHKILKHTTLAEGSVSFLKLEKNKKSSLGPQGMLVRFSRYENLLLSTLTDWSGCDWKQCKHKHVPSHGKKILNKVVQYNEQTVFINLNPKIFVTFSWQPLHEVLLDIAPDWREYFCREYFPNAKQSMLVCFH